MKLVSIITPAYNASAYIADAITSVLSQTYTNWELLIINDGSTDATEEIVQEFSDVRIRYFYQENKGVSAARNVGLEAINGDYFCFLDADDVIPSQSLEVRLNKFSANSQLSFVDGVVSIRSADMKTEISRYKPSVEGEVFANLVKLSGDCFFGPSWMIKKESEVTYKFHEGLTHGEDLCFYLSLAKGRYYDFVEEEVLWYRKGHTSAMSNVVGLEKGYHFFYTYAKQLGADKMDLSYLKKRIRRIVFLSYLFDVKSPFEAVKTLFKRGVF